jgi:ubiquinone/menaquinone biosynthesis C-methylase UbiE
MSDQDTASHRAHMPEGTNAILNTRSLQSSHKRLAELLTPGMAVLDVGCGTGAITRGIAEAAAPNGRVIGLDPNEDLIEEARRLHGDVRGLTFEVGNVYDLPYRNEFDIVTAARVLQWLADPHLALRQMMTAVRPGGGIVVLDYNHEKAVWNPMPPPTMQNFYAAFLHWRAEAGMDNAIADHLAGLFAEIGLHDIQQTVQHEQTNFGDADFDTRIGIWASVAQVRGPQMVDDGFIAEVYRRAAERDYREWAETEAQSQTLYVLCVEGVR